MSIEDDATPVGVKTDGLHAKTTRHLNLTRSLADIDSSADQQPQPKHKYERKRKLHWKRRVPVAGKDRT